MRFWQARAGRVPRAIVQVSGGLAAARRSWELGRPPPHGRSSWHISPRPGCMRLALPGSRLVASQASLPQIAHRSPSALEKAHDRRSDNWAKVIGRLHAIHPTANSQVEEFPMQAPGYFLFMRRQSAIWLVGQASDTPQFEAQRLYDP